MTNRIPAKRTCRLCGVEFTILVGERRYVAIRFGTCPACRSDVARVNRAAERVEAVRVRMPDLSDGLCYGANDDRWFPFETDSAAAKQAADVCRDCPVRRQCLEYAMAAGEQHGVWGGMGPRERYLLRRRRRWAS